MTFRRPNATGTFLAFAALGVHSLLMAAETTPASPPRLGSAVFNWNDLSALRTSVGERRDVVNRPTATLQVLECHITTLNPGQVSHPPHRHAQEELIVVKEGLVEAHLNGETRTAGPGSTFFFASNDMHALRNAGTTPATYWVINVETRATSRPADHNPNPKVRSAIYDYERLVARPSRVGEGRAILDGSTATLKNLETHITTVRGGEASHAAHRHPDEELILVREGTLEATINGVAHRAEPGSIFFFASNDLHGLRNAGDVNASYHVIRIVTADTPQPTPAAGATKAAGK